jgi:GT2 family glycosyltransferase
MNSDASAPTALRDLRKPREQEIMNPSVASVTVAYNAARGLPQKIDALLRQTRPLQEIIVVDNGSTDGTSTMLRQRYPQVKILTMAENLGMAGAWAAGLAYAALEKRHDWTWTFDDDSVPNDDTLELLLQGWRSLDGLPGEVGMLAPLPIHRETGIGYLPLLWRDGFVRPSADLLGKPIWFADLVIVSGCLVRREVVEKVGLPRADFFMDFFDFEYCLRARSQGYRIAVIMRSRLNHEIGNARKVRLPGYSRLWPDHAPWREYYISRNMTYAGWWLYPSRRTKQFIVRHLLRHAAGVLLFGSHKLVGLKRLVQGFQDGRRAQLGARFRPFGRSA